MKCIYCNAIIENAYVPCHTCGKSLERKEITHEEAHAAGKRKAQDRNINLIANIIIALICCAIGLAAIAFVAIRFIGIGKPGKRDDVAKIQLIDFNVVDTDSEYNAKHGSGGKLILHLSVANNGKIKISRLNAKIQVQSPQMQVWSRIGIGDGIFPLVKPPMAINPGDAINTDVCFPVLYNPHGLVKLTLSSDIVLME